MFTSSPILTVSLSGLTLKLTPSKTIAVSVENPSASPEVALIIGYLSTVSAILVSVTDALPLSWLS